MAWKPQQEAHRLERGVEPRTALGHGIVAAAPQQHGVDAVELPSAGRAAQQIEGRDFLRRAAERAGEAANLLPAHRIVRIADLQQQKSQRCEHLDSSSH
jgi:hypothetical protein